jgi:hypothetical protein
MTGTCLCSGVAFEVEPPGTEMELCHCSRCRKAYGSAFAATFYVEAPRFRWTRGEELLAAYELPIQKAPPPYRHVFCRVCGSPLPIVRQEFGVVEVPAGLIDGDPGSRPARHIFIRTKAPWFEITDTLPRHEQAAR